MPTIVPERAVTRGVVTLAVVAAESAGVGALIKLTVVGVVVGCPARSAEYRRGEVQTSLVRHGFELVVDPLS